MRRLASLLFLAPLACGTGAAGLNPSLGGGDVIGPSGDTSGGGDDVGTSDSGDGSDGLDLDAVELDSSGDDVGLDDDVLAVEDVVASEDTETPDDDVAADDVAPLDDVLPEDDTDEPVDTGGGVDTSPLEDVPPVEDVPLAEDVLPVEDVPPVEDVSPVEDVPPAEDVSPVEDVPPVDDIGPDPVDTSDAGASDVGGEDVPPPLGPETVTFRLSDMDFVAPALCLPGPGSCLDITSFANTYLGPVFTDPVEPTDIVLTFTQPDGSELAAVELGEGDCVRSGELIMSCEVANPPPPASFDALVSTTDACLGVAAPCFGTSEVLTSLAVQVGSFQIGLSNAEVAGRIVGAGPDRAIEEGLLLGFLPEKIAKTLTVDAPVFGVLSVAQLLAKAPLVTVNGQPGWMVEFSFAAEEVPGP